MGIRLLGQSSVGSVLIVWATCACHVDGVENTSRQNNYADNLRTQPFAPVEIPGQNLEQILFRHGDGGLWCVRSPSITAAGGLCIALQNAHRRLHLFLSFRRRIEILFRVLKCIPRSRSFMNV